MTGLLGSIGNIESFIQGYCGRTGPIMPGKPPLAGPFPPGLMFTGRSASTA